MGKIRYFIASLVIAAILITAGVLLYVNWNAIKGTIDGSKYYTEENLNEAYDKGFNDALKNEEEMSAQIDYYKGIVDEYYITIQNLQKENADYKNNNVLLQNKVEDLTETKNANEQTITSLESDIAENKITINELNSSIQEFESKVSELSKLKQENENKINELNATIINLNSKIEELENSDEDKFSEIAKLEIKIENLENEVAGLELDVENKNSQISSLSSQISVLQSNIESLQTINQNNLNTITELNNKIIGLNNQISELTLQINNNSSVVNGLNQKIAELQKSISYYETYIANLENETQVVATFEFAGSVYNVQIVNKNSKVSVVNPTSTDYVIFNYWTVNGEQVDLSAYTLTQNTKFIANVTYKQLVKFTVDGQDKNSQFVIRDGYAVAPTNPTKTGYEFNGWTVNGVDVVNVSEYEISQDTTFIAKFTKLYNVTFIYEDDTLSSQEVRNGEYAENVSASSTTYKVFNGWTVNGSLVDVNTYKIVADTTFVADITYKYDVVFKSDNQNIKSQIVIKNSFATAPSSPTKDGYEFDGWTINGTDIVNVGSYKITANTTFIAKFTKLFNVKFVSDGITISNQTIRDGETFIKPSNPSKSGYEFDGWTVNNVIVNLDDYSLTSDVTFTAKFTQLYTVKFIVDGESISTQSIRADSNFSVPTEPTKDGYTFDGWTIDGTTVIDLSSYTLTGDVQFIAKFTSLAGLFAEDGTQTMSWDELIENDYFSVSDDGVLSKGSNSERTSMIGNIIVPVGIVRTSSASALNYGAFYDCSGIKSVKLPEGFTKIGKYTFYGCSSLNNVDMPSTLTTIESRSFSRTGFTSFIIPNSVTAIGSSIFAYTKNFKYLYVPKSVVTIGLNYESMYGLYGCSSDAIIYCETENIQDGWDKLFNYFDKNSSAPIVYNCSLDQFIEETGALL